MDELVRQYLEKRGAKATLNEFDKELQKMDAIARSSSAGTGTGTAHGRRSSSQQPALPNVENQSMTHRYLTSGDATTTPLTSEELIVWGLQNGEPGAYQEGYQTFRIWVEGSLDLVKAELTALCFPIFVVSYMSLVRQGFSDAARALWDDSAEDLRSLYPVEIRDLAMLTSKEQLSTPGFLAAYPFLNQAHHNKFKVRLSSMVANLLTTFLAQNNLLLVAAIVNEKIQIDRTTQLLPADDTVKKPELKGYVMDAVRSTEPQPGLYLGVPGCPPAHGVVQIPNYRESDHWSAWMKTLLIRKVVSREEGQAGDLRGSRSLQAKTSAAAAAAAAGDPLEPSILFATFTNVNDGMICLHMDKEAKQAVAGFRDSCVRIWEVGEASPSSSLSSTSSREKVHTRDFSTTIPWMDVATAGYEEGGGSGAGGPGRTEAGTRRSREAALPGRNASGRSSQMIELRGHSKPVYSVAQSPLESRLVLSSSSDLSIRLWDVGKRHCMVKYNCRMPCWDVSFSPIDYYFAAAGMDRSLSVYSTDRPEAIRIMTGHGSDVTCCRWHGNSCLVASGSDDKTARLWDFRTASSVRTFTGCHSAISCVAISPSGTTFAAGSDSGIVYLWDMAMCLQTAVLRGHTGAIHSIAFSPSGQALTTGGADCSIKIWDISGANAAVLERNTQRAHLKGEPEQLAMLQPSKSFYTKLSPVFFVDYSRDFSGIFAGGPFSVDAMPK